MESNKMPSLPEEYVQLLQKTYAEALEVAEAIQAAAMADREAAADERAAATAARTAIEAQAEQLWAEYLEKHRTQLIEETRAETLTKLVINHLKSGKSPKEIVEWLEVSYEFIEQQRVKMSTQKPSLTGAQLHYNQQGRGGTLTYRKGETMIHFDWEFGGGNCVAIIFVPTEVQWEKATGLPASERLEVLDFVAQQVIRDQAPSCRYEISDHWINILNG